MEQMERTTLTTPDLFDPQLDELICQVGQKLTFPPKHIFSMPGEEIGGIYYIKAGRTKHYMDNTEGGIKILYTLTPGWFFGELTCFIHSQTSLYSQTETHTVLYKVDEGEVNRLMDESRLFRDAMIRSSRVCRQSPDRSPGHTLQADRRRIRDSGYGAYCPEYSAVNHLCFF